MGQSLDKQDKQEFGLEKRGMADRRQRREKGLPSSIYHNAPRGPPVSESMEAVFELRLEKPVGFPKAEMEGKGFSRKRQSSLL